MVAASGKRARTRKPRPGRGPASAVPPRACARSRMPAMPRPPSPAIDARRRRRPSGGRPRPRRRRPPAPPARRAARRRRTVARVAAAWRTTLVSASWAMRKAARSTPGGQPVGDVVGRDRPPVAVHPLDAHVEAGAAGPLDEARRGRPARRWGPAAAASPWRSTSSTERSSPRASLLASLMAASAGAHLVGVDGVGLLVDQVQRHAGPHVDQRDVVGEHVVQLAGDAQALLAGAAAGLLGRGPPGARRPARAGPGPARWPTRAPAARRPARRPAPSRATARRRTRASPRPRARSRRPGRPTASRRHPITTALT